MPEEIRWFWNEEFTNPILKCDVVIEGIPGRSDRKREWWKSVGARSGEEGGCVITAFMSSMGVGVIMLQNLVFFLERQHQDDGIVDKKPQQWRLHSGSFKCNFAISLIFPHRRFIIPLWRNHCPNICWNSFCCFFFKYCLLGWKFAANRRPIRARALSVNKVKMCEALDFMFFSGFGTKL